MTIQGVFFDAAGTLMQPVRPVGETYAHLARHYGIKVTPSDVTARFHFCFASTPPLAFPKASRSELLDLECAWWKKLVQEVFEPWGPFPGFDDYFAGLFSHFAQPEAWKLFPEVMGTLVLLKERDLILDVVSNFDSRLIGILEGLGVAPYLDQIFVSSRIGYAKPAREIFQAALDAHGIAAKHIIHVGDSQEKDFDGARSAGLEALLIDRNLGLPGKPLWTISNLNEIVFRIQDSPNRPKPSLQIRAGAVNGAKGLRRK